MRTAVTERYIDATEGVREKLAKAFHCTSKFVYMSLTYRADSEKARKIRHTAVNEYGATPMRHCPECETLHETTEDGREIMRQEWNNGAVLVWYKGSSEVIVRHKGRDVLHENCESLPRFTEIQLYAESL